LNKTKKKSVKESYTYFCQKCEADFESNVQPRAVGKNLFHPNCPSCKNNKQVEYYL